MPRSEHGTLESPASRHLLRQGADRGATRIACLDGLRGVAIGLVVLYHCYARWPELMPWATGPNALFPIQYGYLGVELFFLISGFVILMTLERSGSFVQFLYRRWLRLFPAMLVATLLIVATTSWLPQRPAGQPALVDPLPGLMFVEPILLSKILGRPIQPIEGVFWSLFVEVKFYFLFGTLYFTFRSLALRLLVGMFALGFAYNCALALDPTLATSFLNFAMFVTSVSYFGWFAIGALIYLAYNGRGGRFGLYSALLLPAAIGSSLGFALGDFLGGAAVYLIFVLGLFWRPLARALSGSPLVLAGFISYPLYLIHENAMVALGIQFHEAFPVWPGPLAPLPGLLLLATLAWFIARFVEPAVHRMLIGLFRYCRLSRFSARTT